MRTCSGLNSFPPGLRACSGEAARGRGARPARTRGHHSGWATQGPGARGRAPGQPRWRDAHPIPLPCGAREPDPSKERTPARGLRVNASAHDPGWAAARGARVTAAGRAAARGRPHGSSRRTVRRTLTQASARPVRALLAPPVARQPFTTPTERRRATFSEIPAPCVMAVTSATSL